jgi:hypothetical protein
MKFQLGDKIILLHSGEEGEVADFINDKMLLVDVNGVRFPVYADQVDFPYFKRFTEVKPVPQKKLKTFVEDVRPEKPQPRKGVPNGVSLLFFPIYDKDVFDDDVVDHFRLYLTNQTEDSFLFTYHLRFMGEKDFDLKNEIAPWTEFYLHDVPLDHLNDSPRFEFDFSLKEYDKKRLSHYEAAVKLKAKQLFQKIHETLEKNDAHFSYPLFSKYPMRPEDDFVEFAGKVVLPMAQGAKKGLEAARTVVDLHIEKLTDDWKGLDNLSKLDLQMKAFEKYYDLALAHRLPQLIVVHGVGKGVLRDEIHEWLRHRREVRSFVNQYHPSFGYGATEIYLQYP